MKKLCTLFLALVASSALWAEDFIVDGIAYNILGGDSVEVTTTWPKYSGSITIPASVIYESTTYRVTRIGDNAFHWCDSLSSVTIGNSVTSIGEYALEGCSSLSSINVDAANTHYASVDGVLVNYAKDTLIQYPIGNTRTSYTIPNSVTSIGYYAFNNCKALSSVTIPNSVIRIGDYAFNYCKALSSVTIPNSVIRIGDYAFNNCKALSSVTIGNSVTSIGEYAFTRCTSLNSVTIGNSVTSIGSYAFCGCDSLSFITCYATTPPTCSEKCFLNVDKSIPLYVPSESVAAYKAADTWKDFTNIQAITTDIKNVNVNANANVNANRKVMMEGQLLILHDGKTYNLNGNEVK